MLKRSFALLRPVRPLLRPTLVQLPPSCPLPVRHFSSTRLTYNSNANSNSVLSPLTATTQAGKVSIGRVDRRLQITFTCTAAVPSASLEGVGVEAGAGGEGKAGQCGHRSSHEFSKNSYEKGIVLVECPSCKNRHLIADNLSWFSSTPSPSHPDGLPIGTKERRRTIEDLMKEKGEEVKWGEKEGEGTTWELEVR